MPRAGAIIFGDLEDKLDVLHVACKKCDRRGQYPVGRTRSRPVGRLATRASCDCRSATNLRYHAHLTSSPNFARRIT